MGLSMSMTPKSAIRETMHICIDAAIKMPRASAVRLDAFAKG